MHRCFRAGGTGQAKTGPLFSANSVMIVAFTNAICMNVVMIVTISMHVAGANDFVTS